MYINDKKSIYEICEILSEQCILTKYDKQHKWKDHYKKLKVWHWHSSTVRWILSDEIYIWKYYYWKTYTKKDRRTWKETTCFREKADPLLVEMSCPRIIKDDEIFFKTKELLDKNIDNKNRNRTYDYTWYIECWKCGKKYVWYKSLKDTTSYRCWGSVSWKTPKEFRCDNHEISEIFIVDTAWKEINNLLKNPDKILEKYYKANWTEISILEQYKEELEKITQEVEKNTNWLSYIYTEYYTETDKNIKKIKESTIETFKTKLWTLNSRKEELESKIEKYSRTEKNKSNIKRVVNKFVSKFKNNIDDNKKVEIIKEFVDKIKILEDWNIMIWLKFYTWTDRDNQSDEWW